MLSTEGHDYDIDEYDELSDDSDEEYENCEDEKEVRLLIPPHMHCGIQNKGQDIMGSRRTGAGLMGVYNLIPEHDNRD
nr:ADM_HP1_G0029170.mRNA.1.CDS.1 [Saccharomyces cerevisiae]